MPNQLALGTRRTGSLIDFNEETDRVQVVLERDEKGIKVLVPWVSPEDYYATWFLGGAIQGLGPEKVATPKQLLFHDSHGPVFLVDCYAQGYHSNFFSGTGTVWARYAIPGVSEEVDFMNPHGLRSVVSGLRDWLGQRSIDQDLNENVLTVTANLGTPIVVDETLTFQPSWKLSTGDQMESVTVRDLVYCETRSDEPKGWAELRRAHLGIRDLLVISRWVAETCTVAGVVRVDDPLKTMDGEEHGEQWREVVSKDDNPPAPHQAAYQPHLIEFDDIHVEGIRRWLALRDDFRRALDPIVSDRVLDRVGAVTHMAQIGPGIEALGYLLFLRDGLSPQKANAKNLQARLERILVDIAEVVPFDSAAWAIGTAEAYNGIKHANRTLPSELELLNRWRESVLACRLWVAVELGVEASDLTARVKNDPQVHPYIARG